ncbi:MAG: DUF86 domain-containing protein [Nitrospiraceae bacterium]|nr:MAG: DUF86 domain-containing protein [Nitrospiraceae bacterium]
MPLFNPDKIAKLISEMRKAVTRLQSLKALDKDIFLSDPDKISSAKYNFVVAIESAIDICNHVISKNSYRVPDDYADTFQVMGENGAFDKDFIDVLKEMAKFRNRLIHLYMEIDDEQLCKILQLRLDDFKTFLDGIAVFLELENF